MNWLAGSTALLALLERGQSVCRERERRHLRLRPPRSHGTSPTRLPSRMRIDWSLRREEKNLKCEAQGLHQNWFSHRACISVNRIGFPVLVVFSSFSVMLWCMLRCSFMSTQTNLQFGPLHECSRISGGRRSRLSTRRIKKENHPALPRPLTALSEMGCQSLRLWGRSYRWFEAAASLPNLHLRQIPSDIPVSR